MESISALIEIIRGGIMQLFHSVIITLGWIIISGVTIAQSNWTEQNSGVTTELRTVKAVSPSIAWIGGYNGVVLRTTDGGTTWDNVGGGTIGTGNIYSIAAMNESEALVTTTISTDTYIFRTTDAGVSWTQVYTLNPSFINAIWMLDASKGIAVGDPVEGKFVVLKTEDSGLSWARLTTEPEANASEFGFVGSLCVRDNSLIWFGTSAGRVLHSTDLGTTWTSGTTPSPYVTHVWFNDPLVGIVAASSTTGAATAKSTDGGNSWTEIADVSFHEMFGDGYEKFFGVGNIQGGSNGVYECSNTSFIWNKVNIPLNHINQLSVGRNNSTNFGWLVSNEGIIIRYDEEITYVQKAKTILTGFKLTQNYPNPFNPSTKIKYSIPKNDKAKIKIFDIIGNEIATLVNEEKIAGTYEVTWNAIDLPSGVYFYQLKAGSFFETKKMILMK